MGPLKMTSPPPPPPKKWKYTKKKTDYNINKTFPCKKNKNKKVNKKIPIIPNIIPLNTNLVVFLKKRNNELDSWWTFISYRRYGGRDIRICTVEHLHPMRTVLRVEGRHDQTGDHDKEANQDQDGGDQVFALKPAAGGELEEARGRNDEDQRRGTQDTLEYDSSILDKPIVTNLSKINFRSR